jgi:DNA-binding CsgD family transcriptional regulator
LAALGLPARHLSRRLSLSELTVNGHLGSIYRKAGVSGRDELLARLA